MRPLGWPWQWAAVYRAVCRMKTFLICPIRGQDADRYVAAVRRLEEEGYLVHWPLRDTDQNDPTGFAICSSNAAAIANADIVHVIWDGESEGCLFDLGVAFALGKRIVPLDLPAPTSEKSFQNMIRAWVDRGKPRGYVSESRESPRSA